MATRDDDASVWLLLTVKLPVPLLASKLPMAVMVVPAVTPSPMITSPTVRLPAVRLLMLRVVPLIEALKVLIGRAVATGMASMATEATTWARSTL